MLSRRGPQDSDEALDLPEKRLCGLRDRSGIPGSGYCDPGTVMTGTNPIRKGKGALEIFGNERIRLTVAYDGTNYCGWQIQPNGITIQEVLENCLEDLTGKKTPIMGASRTDTGVHALGNVAVFDTDMRMPGEKFSFALNQSAAGRYPDPEIRRSTPGFSSQIPGK